MSKYLLILLGLAGMLRAEDGGYDEISISNAIAQWHAETNSESKAKLEESIVHQCGVSEKPEIAEELISGKPLEEARISILGKEKPLTLIALKEWDLVIDGFYQIPEEVIRRIGPKNFELWTPKAGWLFNENGSVLDAAKVPRRDGLGREWYGAFLPGGQWITTDLWAQDDRIYIFSPENKLLRAFPTKKYTGKPKNDWSGYTVAWARADQNCTKWAAQIGMDGGWCGLLISPWGWRQRVSAALAKMHLPSPSSWALARKVEDPKAFVDSRNLGSRGNCVLLSVQSPDGKGSLEHCGHMHGSETELPTYSMRGLGLGWDHVIPTMFHGKYTGTGNFGFFPDSQVIWVGGEKNPVRPTQHMGGFRSWIIESSGRAIGWLSAERVADDSDGKRMWFVDEQGRLLKVASDGKVSEVLQPTLAGATGNEAPFAHVLFPDLKLGFFYTKPGHLVLAKWN
jgi:hypothetical protein